jgi:hypothetical protein
MAASPAQCRGCWRRNPQSEAHRDRHRLNAAPTAASRRRADDHLGRCVERARCRGCSITWMRTRSRNCAARPNGSGLRSRPGRAPADRAYSGPAPRRLSRGRIGTHSRGRAGGQRSGRLANVDALDLAAGKVQSERRRIALDCACARRRTRRCMSAATPLPKPRNFPRSRPMKVGSSAGTSSTAHSIRRITRASRHAYLRCRYWRASA